VPITSADRPLRVAGVKADRVFVPAQRAAGIVAFLVSNERAPMSSRRRNDNRSRHDRPGVAVSPGKLLPFVIFRLATSPATQPWKPNGPRQRAEIAIWSPISAA
jgi:hypothetical protein